MTNARSKTHLAKWLLFGSLGLSVLMTGMNARGLSRIATGYTTFDGISCDDLMKIYKRAYTYVGFRFKNKEPWSVGMFLLNFNFPNTVHINKPAGIGGIRFSVPQERTEVSCNVERYVMGIPSDNDTYSIEEHDAFEERIFSASNEAEALVRKKVGKKVSIHFTNPPNFH
ncbi:MAG TPA: hypothetical protein VG962_15485 [Steroidobacteraceae bacterium]|nr:hypothetical protein [Steroidobacteraceae bacterium]